MMSWKEFYSKGKNRYAIDESGKVINTYSGKELHPQVGKHGYAELKYGGRADLRKQYVHRLVAFAFVPNPYGYNIVNHKNGDKLNNHAWNLEWVDHNENMRHMARMGLIKNQRSKRLTPDEVFDIRTLGLYGFRAKELSQSFKVHTSTIRKILKCEDWRHEIMPERERHERSFQGMELQDGFALNDQSLQRYYSELHRSGDETNPAAVVLPACEPGFNPEQAAGVHETV
jgi:hypothetical protein